MGIRPTDLPLSPVREAAPIRRVEGRAGLGDSPDDQAGARQDAGDQEQDGNDETVVVELSGLTSDVTPDTGEGSSPPGTTASPEREALQRHLDIEA